MKKNFLLLIIAVMAIVACQQTPKAVTVDIQAEEAALNGFMDNFDKAILAGDDSIARASITEDALICGTDPSEFWTKQQFLGPEEQDSAAAAVEMKNISERVIKVAPDGNSAIAVTQLIISWSPKVPLRIVYHFIKADDQWRIQFINVAFIAKNEDIQKLNQALE